MNGELAQVIALVAHGNLFLHGGVNAEAPDLFHTNSTFQYISSIKFARYLDKSQSRGTEVATDVPDWFRFMRASGARRLWHIAFAWGRRDIAEHQAVAFAGGVPMAIQADLPGAFELWYPAWRYEGGAGSKPWTVEYRSLMFDTNHALPQLELGVVKARLRDAIAQAELFARGAGDSTRYWAEWFSKALRLLDDTSPNPPYHPDMLPEEGYSLAARQILAAAAQAYVFGGMGSWNDLWLDEEGARREYERVTRELYESIKLATVAAPNSFPPQHAI